MEAVDARIKNIICESTGYEWGDIKPSDNLISDLGMDSLDIAKMEVEAEDVLGIDVEPNAFNNIHTVAELVARLEEMVGIKGVF
jgi:acyl carrier protein